MFRSHAGTAHFADLVTDGVESGNRKFHFGIETSGRGRLLCAENPVGADHLVVLFVHHQQVAAVVIETVAVKSVAAILQPSLFFPEHPVAEALGCFDFGRRLRQFQPEMIQFGQYRGFSAYRQAPEKITEAAAHPVRMEIQHNRCHHHSQAPFLLFLR
ncbi:hypothetical protein SDC9_169662 [bioreactor metagenome]|uniref:Uncharacterized protein n=1 Tax=bioreactor metagenome TaxID=1076179 RepID=A0A645G907_9ZZZZ